MPGEGQLAAMMGVGARAEAGYAGSPGGAMYSWLMALT